MGNAKRPDEFELIARFFAPLAEGESGALGLQDDAALLRPEEGKRLIVTTDTLSAGVHFPAEEAPGDIAAKLLGVNLSDLAAMGARPWVYTLSLSLPEDWQPSFLEEFAQELGRQQEAYGLHLVGGDTVAGKGPLTLTLTVIGTVDEGGELRRGGAQAGDHVYLSGTLGDGALGLRVMQGEIDGLAGKHAEELLARYRRPRPRVQLGLRLAGLASAAIDVSDGLVADLGHLAKASAHDAIIEAGRVPFSDAARAAFALNPDLMKVALTGGDDYELLFTAPSTAADDIEGLSKELDLALTRIGQMGADGEDAGDVRVIGDDGREMTFAEAGYRHF
jgi:thiamine-monophosphate kinase